MTNRTGWFVFASSHVETLGLGVFFLLMAIFSVATTLTRTHGASDVSIITRNYSANLIFLMLQPAAPVAIAQMHIGKRKVIKTFLL